MTDIVSTRSFETNDDADAVTPGSDPIAVAAQISQDVGARLRVLREQRQMSLIDVESFSEGRFGPSTIGAYERGERAISLPRLHRLAELYGVPLAQLVPIAGEQAVGQRWSPISEPLCIDLAMLRQLSGQGFVAMLRFIENIRERRHDVHSSVCTLRGADALVIGAMLDVPVDQVVARLRALDLSADETPVKSA